MIFQLLDDVNSSFLLILMTRYIKSSDDSTHLPYAWRHAARTG